ncbi:MAG: hypothetical protein B7Y83_17540 [Flavobacteriales bacterium 32-34-25]|nr:MAG: hypothetical protein B7Y83_17540 [Flavobacteriales bacterium 32-34-25]
MVEVSLIESILDVQFEAITSYLNDGGKLQERGDVAGSAHAFLSAPYGVYKTQDGYLSLAMGDLMYISALLEVNLEKYKEKHLWFEFRDEIRTLLSDRLAQKTTDHWLQLLQEKGVWCGKVLNYQDLDQIDFGMPMKQTIENSDNKKIVTTRSPIQLDGEILMSRKAAPKVGEHNKIILETIIN